MTPERWERTNLYCREVFGAQDEQLATLMERAVAQGIPDIAVSADVGRLLKILISTTRAQTALEFGTLAGYSGVWIARGLAPGGRLYTCEPEPKHADFAQREFDRAGVADRVEIIRRPALDAMPDLRAKLGDASVDFVLLDAIKTEYPDYFEAVRPMIAPGGLLIADNALGTSSWWIDQPQGESADRDAMDRFNRAVAAAPAFETSMIPLREGLLIARRSG